MVKDDPLKWEVEPPENFLVSHFLFRGVHQILWKNWPDINTIQPNFYITIVIFLAILPQVFPWERF